MTARGQWGVPDIMSQSRALDAMRAHSRREFGKGATLGSKIEGHLGFSKTKNGEPLVLGGPHRVIGGSILWLTEQKKNFLKKQYTNSGELLPRRVRSVETRRSPPPTSSFTP